MANWLSGMVFYFKSDYIRKITIFYVLGFVVSGGRAAAARKHKP